MKSKSAKTAGKQPQILRNSIAANPLLGKGGSHKNGRSHDKLARSKSRRKMQKLRREWSGEVGSGSTARKDNWQSVFSRAFVLLFVMLNAAPGIFCQLSFLPLFKAVWPLPLPPLNQLAAG